MKFSSTILTLLTAIATADAFTAQRAASTTTTTRLASSPEGRGAFGEAPASYSSDKPRRLGGTGDSYTDSLQAGPPRPGPRLPMSAKEAVMDQPPVKVQGGSLKTWALRSSAIERVRVVLETEGRPMDADIDLWHGPDNTPNKMRVYVEDGARRPFSCVLETPRGPNTVAIRNIGQLEFPLDAYVLPNPEDHGLDGPVGPAASNKPPHTIQGGALRTYNFDSHVESVQILMSTDGRPLNSRIELLQGPNNIKQVLELYIEDGMERPFFLVLETPGSGNVVRIVNTAPVEFPLLTNVEPYILSDFDAQSDVVVGGGDGGNFGSRDLQWS